jgi:hypothetical protein
MLFLPREKNYFSIIKLKWLMLGREIIVLYSGNIVKMVNVMCGQNAVLLNVEASDTYNK